MKAAVAGLVPQDPAIALYHETVREELAETLRNRRSGCAARAQLRRTAAGCQFACEAEAMEGKVRQGDGA